MQTCGHKKSKPERSAFIVLSSFVLCLVQLLVRNCEFLSAFCPTGSQYATAVFGGHSLTESVFIPTLSLRRLECSFHCHNIFPFLMFLCHFYRTAKVCIFFNRANNAAFFAVIFYRWCPPQEVEFVTHLCSRHLATRPAQCRHSAARS